MDLLLVCLVSLVLGGGVVWWLMRRPTSVRPAAPMPVVAPVEPDIEHVTPFPAPPPPEARVTLFLVSPKGEPIGKVSVPKRQRRPTFAYTPKLEPAPWLFVAERQVEGGFLYRQVGRERA